MTSLCIAAVSRCTIKDIARIGQERKWRPRPFLGLNFRMTELEGAVLLAQIRRIDVIRETLRANRDIVRGVLEGVAGLGFRSLPDPDGDLATHLVVNFPTAEIARRVTDELQSITLDRSGWHVYHQMEHLMTKRTVTGRGCPFNCTHDHGERGRYRQGMLPATDQLLERSTSFAIGVLDPNLAPFGLCLTDPPGVVRERAETFAGVARKYLT